MPSDVTSLIWFGTVAFFAALSALFILTLFDPIRHLRRWSLLSRDSNLEESVFLFEGDRLIDATPPARQILEAAPQSGSHWTRLVGLLGPIFPESGALADLDTRGDLELYSDDGTTRLTARQQGAIRRIGLIDVEDRDSAVNIDRHSLAAMRNELETLRANTDTAPFLVWRESASGQITWVNRAYMDTIQRVHGLKTARTWPPPALFEPAAISDAADRRSVRRLCLKLDQSGSETWFDCHAAPLGDEVLMTAVDVSIAVDAEVQLREFMQTLTKTFAHLTVGLAIFDRSRRLALFNPALTDLTGLQVDFLTARPTLLGFLDRLRERQMMPEPKDYRTWRKEIAELENAAADGTYSETWSLGSGQTYRVTGRPHPDGAIAFIFEDISAEISLTRRFRAELEMGQSVIDAMEDAIAVFTSNGVLAMSNSAYSDVWGTDPAMTLQDVSIIEATRTWINKSAPSPIWGDLRDFVMRQNQRSEWSAPVQMLDGRALDCRIVPLPGGSTLIQFTPRHGPVEGGQIRRLA